MKKIIFITLAIITVIIGTTGVLITKFKSDLEHSNIGITIIDKENNQDNIETPAEKTLDLYGTYNQNDLLIIDKEIHHESFEEPIKIKQISGLKNKEIENKINTDIEQNFLNIVNKFYTENDLYDRYAYLNVNANFSNVISISGYVSGTSKEPKHVSQNFGFNYNLSNGEKIEFKDLFVQNADIQTMIRSALYKIVEKNQDAFYDEELGKWMQTRWEYDEETYECYEVTEDYVPYFTENEIAKIVQKFIANPEIKFSFSPSEIYIYEPQYCEIKFEDFADMVTIYNKYLAEESLYENDDIGLENILTCSREVLDTGNCFYKKTSYEGENFFYDITIKENIYEDREMVEDTINRRIEACVATANKTVEEYRILAENNPDKMYILLLCPTLHVGRGDFTGEFDYSNEEFHNLLSIGCFEKVISGDIAQKDEFLYKLLGTYRYPNLGMYMDIYHGVNQVMYEDYYFDSIEENVEFTVFDVHTGNEITELKDIFKEDVDYKKIIEDAFKGQYAFKQYYDGEKYMERTEEELEELFSRVTYDFDANSIYAFIDGKYEEYKCVSLSSREIWPYLNLQKLGFGDV